MTPIVSKKRHHASEGAAGTPTIRSGRVRDATAQKKNHMVETMEKRAQGWGCRKGLYLLSKLGVLYSRPMRLYLFINYYTSHSVIPEASLFLDRKMR